MKVHKAKMVWGIILFAMGFIYVIGYAAGDDSVRAAGAGPLAISIIALLGGIFLVYAAIKYGPSQKKQKSRDNNDFFDPSQPIPVIDNPSMVLRPNEKCYIMEKVQAGKAKNVVTGYTSGNKGVSVHIAKGITLRGGASKGKPIRKTVIEKYPGILYVTSQRVILNSMKYGFEKPIKHFSSYQLYTDGVNLTFGKESYLIMTNRPRYIAGVITHISSVLQHLSV